MLFKKKSSNEPRRVRQPQAKDGSGAQPVFSYHARSARTEPGGIRSVSKLLWVNASKASPRKPAHSRARRVLVVSALILAVALVLNSLFLSRNPSVVTIADTPGRQLLLRSQETYQQAARAILSSSLSNTNKLTIDTGQIAKSLEDQFPELEQVSVTLPLVGRQPVIYIQPVQPALLIRPSSGGEVFVLDGSGRAVLGASQVPKLDKLGLAVVEDQSGLPVSLGRAALPSVDVAFITEVIGQLKAKKLNITALVLPKGTSELDIRIEGKPYVIKFNLRGDARVEVGAFLAVKQHLESQRKVPSSYIDVRVDNRAYYR